MAKPILVGSPAVSRKESARARHQSFAIEIVDPRLAALIDRYASCCLPEWKSRGVTEIEAAKRLRESDVFRCGNGAGGRRGWICRRRGDDNGGYRARGNSLHWLERRRRQTVSSFFLMALSSERI